MYIKIIRECKTDMRSHWVVH